jgi:hypothetical protein
MNPDLAITSRQINNVSTAFVNGPYMLSAHQLRLAACPKPWLLSEYQEPNLWDLTPKP